MVSGRRSDPRAQVSIGEQTQNGFRHTSYIIGIDEITGLSRYNRFARAAAIRADDRLAGSHRLKVRPSVAFKRRCTDNHIGRRVDLLDIFAEADIVQPVAQQRMTGGGIKHLIAIAPIGRHTEDFVTGDQELRFGHALRNHGRHPLKGDMALDALKSCDHGDRRVTVSDADFHAQGIAG